MILFPVHLVALDHDKKAALMVRALGGVAIPLFTDRHSAAIFAKAYGVHEIWVHSIDNAATLISWVEAVETECPLAIWNLPPNPAPSMPVNSVEIRELIDQLKSQARGESGAGMN